MYRDEIPLYDKKCFLNELDYPDFGLFNKYQTHILNSSMTYISLRGRPFLPRPKPSLLKNMCNEYYSYYPYLTGRTYKHRCP